MRPPEDERWEIEPSAEILRPRVARQLALPWRERRFLYSAYERLLESLADSARFLVVPLREFREAPHERILVGLRHDVDDRLESAVELGRLEHERGLRSTYFVLHTTPYYARRDEVLAALRRLQDDYGHEIGWHNDLVTLQCVHGVEPREYLARELEWLRGAGIDVVGTAAHGSYWSHARGYHNVYFFSDFDEVVPGFPNSERVGDCLVAKGTLSEFGLEYEAGHLGEEHYYSDARFDSVGRRWHPDFLDLRRFDPGEAIVLLVHACHWDASFEAKAARTLMRGLRRLAGGPRRRSAPPPAPAR